MKNIFSQIFLVLFAACSAYGQSTIDTLYYDAQWKGCEPAFATYYRIYAISSDSSRVKRYRDYFITGELQGEGEFISLDKYNDDKSVFDGEYTTYFKSGRIEQKGRKYNGLDEGEYTKYDEKGLVVLHTYFTDGVLDGIYTEFTKDNLCYQLEYAHGKALNSYYTLSNTDGYCSKVDLITNKPVYESPTAQDLKMEFKHGDLWPFYNKNGLMIGMTNKKVKDYGRYFQISIVMSNNSLYPVEFDPLNIQAIVTDKKGNLEGIKVLQADEYLNKVKRRQNWSVALSALAEGMSASNAGYSYSTSNAYYTDLSGYGNVGYASVTTKTYDAAAAYQAQVIASERVASYSDALLSEREIKNQGYLRKTTVYPGETVSGFINIEREKGVSLEILLNIAGVAYPFSWDIRKL